jgi:KUP system potassium uptake protein
MWVWLRAKDIRNDLTDFVKIEPYIEQLKELSGDQTLPKYATNLVFLSKSKRTDEIEHTIMYSILQKQPKRADVYWFVHIETTDEPDTMEYRVKVHAAEDVARIHFRLGFRVEQRVSMFLRKVIEEMVEKDEIHVGSRYHSLKERNTVGDFRFIILDEVLSTENNLPLLDKLVLSIYFGLKRFTASPSKWFGLDTSMVETELVPLFFAAPDDLAIKRVD